MREVGLTMYVGMCVNACVHVLLLCVRVGLHVPIICLCACLCVPMCRDQRVRYDIRLQINAETTDLVVWSFHTLLGKHTD